jgi:hypothetical protein
MNTRIASSGALALSSFAAAALAQETPPAATPTVSATATATPPCVAAPAPEKPLDAPKPLQLAIASDNPSAALFRIDRFARRSGSDSMETEGLTQICGVPCNQTVDASALYRIAGPGIAPSSSFALPLSRRAVDLRIKAGSVSAQTAGRWLMYTAGVPGVVGAVFSFPLLLTVADGKPIPDAPYTWITVGALGASAALLAAGVALFFSNETTVVTGDGQALASEAPRRRPPMGPGGWTLTF